MSSVAGRRLLATVLAVLVGLVLAGGLGMGLYLERSATAAGVGSLSTEEEERDRLAVLAAAERFTETWNTFTPDQAQAYVDRVAPLLTSQFRADFTEAAADVVTGIQRQQLSSTGEVLVDEDGIPLVGIARIDADSATVLVVSNAERVAGGQRVLRNWRWEVTLVKEDTAEGGAEPQWLVDEFKEI